MNWDKQSVLAVIIGAAALIAWYTFGPRMTQSTAPAASEPIASAPAQRAAVNHVAASTPVSSAVPTVAAMPVITINGGDSEYFIQPVSGAVEKVVFSGKFFKNDYTTPLAAVNIFPEKSGKSSAYGAFGLRSAHGDLTTIKVLRSQLLNPHEYLLSRLVRDTAGTEFEVVTKYHALDNCRMQTTMQIINKSNHAVALPPLLVSAGDLQQWQRMSGDKKSNSQELHTVEYCNESGKVKNENTNCDQDDWSELTGRRVRWFGVTNRFFAQLMKVNAPNSLQPERVEYAPGSKEYIACCSAQLDAFTLPPGSSKEFSFDYYIGPKQPKLLRSFDPEATEVMHLGWFPIDFLAYIMLAILNWIHGFIGSFGISIIVLTLLIRTIFFPVTMKANASMREMQTLSPKLKEIREKYKDEPMVAQTKMSELYREHKVNPLGGCLPMLIQIPVFIALYYALGSAVELRQQSFLWIKDLSQPDTVAHIFNLAINPLIIAWTLLMVVQQKLTPTAMDPTQAKVMLVMPLVMLFILYNLPAALTLYWTVSQIFSIAQMIYQNKLKKREEMLRRSGNSEKAQDKPKIVRS